jgi:hypothetical protein
VGQLHGVHHLPVHHVLGVPVGVEVELDLALLLLAPSPLGEGLVLVVPNQVDVVDSDSSRLGQLVVVLFAPLRDEPSAGLF